MSELNFSELEAKLTQKFSKIIFSEAIQTKKITLQQALDQNQVKNARKWLRSLRDVVEAKLYALCEFYAVGQYTWMQRTQKWTEAGQDRVKLSYIRLLLDIPVDEEVSFSAYSEFEEKIRVKQQRYHIDSMETADLDKKIRYPKIELFGKTFLDVDVPKINLLLEIVESPRRMMLGDSGGLKGIVFGVARSEKYGKYSVYFFEKEEMRTPNNVHYIVAMIDHDQIAIRQEVCRYVFYNKWVPVGEQDLFQIEMLRGQDEENIAEKIKQIVKKLFVGEGDGFKEKENEFVTLMVENLLYHELSHDVLEESNISYLESKVVEGLSTESETILSVMTEILTEWMPLTHGLKGPLRNIVDVALAGDQNRAKKMLFMYLSDAWFLDTDTRFMYSYTYVMFIILVNYIEPDGEVDFLVLNRDFKSIFEFLAGWYRSSATELILQVKQITYSSDGKTYSYQDLEFIVSMYVRLLEVEDNIKGRDERDREANYWMNFYGQLKYRDQSALDKIIHFVRTKENDLYAKLMERFATPADREKYGMDIRQYVIDAMKRKGFIVGDVA